MTTSELILGMTPARCRTQVDTQAFRGEFKSVDERMISVHRPI